MSYTCPKCGKTSYHPEDERRRYCARCDRFEDDPILDIIASTAGEWVVARCHEVAGSSTASGLAKPKTVRVEREGARVGFLSSHGIRAPTSTNFPDHDHEDLRMTTSVEELVKEIEANDRPVEYAMFISGVMAGLICKHTGSNEFAAYMRMIVALHDQEQGEPPEDTTEIDRLMEKLKDRFPLS